MRQPNRTRANRYRRKSDRNHHIITAANIADESNRHDGEKQTRHDQQSNEVFPV
jgi:hypothetical protein